MADDRLSGDFNANKSPAQDFDKAIVNQDAARLKSLISSLRLPKDQREDFLTGQLRKACAEVYRGKACTEIIDALIDAGGKPDKPLGHEFSAFGIICQSNDLSLLRHLIKRGADVNADVNHDQFGSNKPLHVACDSGSNPEVVQELLNHKANPNAKGFFGQTPLHVLAAAKPRRDQDRTPVIDLLLGHGAKVNAVDKWEQTPLLSLIAHSPDGKTATKLIDAGANLSHVSRIEGSALHLAAERGMHEIVDLLVRKGAPLLLKNAEGLTPREHVARHLNQAQQTGQADAVDHGKCHALLDEAEKQIRRRDVRKLVKHKWGI
jgi:ankyrin repeat protein